MKNNQCSVLDLLRVKSYILTNGCNVDNGVVFPKSMHEKSIHLYSHSTEKSDMTIPDDIILKGDIPIISRVRFNSNSKFSISFNKGNFYLEDKKLKKKYELDFIEKSPSINIEINGNKMGSICSYLGKDLLGVTPSNYCFYFKGGRECRFCEIWQNFKNDTSFRKSFKNSQLIAESIRTSLENDQNIKHLAITSGNIKDYDYTANFYVELGKKLKNIKNIDRLDNILATLMPPENIYIIDKIKESGFNKIYFPLEVYDKHLFSIVCPGKLEYGYDKIINALEYAVDVFGVGNVYTNFVYGIQSLDSSLNPNSHDSLRENELSLKAVDFMLNLKVIPAFTIYHYSGYNKIGEIKINYEELYKFFINWGERVLKSNLVNEENNSVIFSQMTLSNTMYNDGFLIAKTLKENK